MMTKTPLRRAARRLPRLRANTLRLVLALRHQNEAPNERYQLKKYTITRRLQAANRPFSDFSSILNTHQGRRCFTASTGNVATARRMRDL
jgi:hypothetical protein